LLIRAGANVVKLAFKVLLGLFKALAGLDFELKLPLEVLGLNFLAALVLLEIGDGFLALFNGVLELLKLNLKSAAALRGTIAGVMGVSESVLEFLSLSFSRASAFLKSVLGVGLRLELILEFVDLVEVLLDVLFGERTTTTFGAGNLGLREGLLAGRLGLGAGLFSDLKTALKFFGLRLELLLDTVGGLASILLIL
jgi:hypothetical protein